MIYIYITVLSMAISMIMRVTTVSSDELGIPLYDDHIFIRFLVLFLSSLPFWIISSFRYEVGTDYYTYSNIQIPRVLNHMQNTGVAPLYKWIIYFGNDLYKNNYQMIFIITATIIITFVFIYINKRSLDLTMSISLLTLTTFFNFSLNVMRQSVATAIFLFATVYIVEGKPVKYYFWIIISICFHYSAIIYIPLYFVRYLKLSLKRSLSILIVVEIVNLFFLKYLINIIFKISGYGDYILNGYLSSKDTKILVLNVFLLIIISFVSGFSSKDFNMNLNVDIRLFIVLMAMQIAISGIPNSNRLLYLLLPIHITLVPNLLNQLKNKMLRLLIKEGTYIVYIIFFIDRIIINNYNETLPYQFWLFWR